MARSTTSPASIVLQDRDIALLRGLFESRVMTADHVARLYFDGRDEAAKKRLQKLKVAGLVGERPRRAFEPAVLFLTRAGLIPLDERGILQEYPAFDIPALERRARVSPITLRHELEVMDVKTAISAAITKAPTFSLVECNTWPRLNEFTAPAATGGPDVMVRPDGFIRVHEKEADSSISEHAFYLELDRSTETQDVLTFRAQSYLHYYKSGGFAQKCGGTPSEFKDYPFRVLMVFKTAERRNNTAERLIQGNPPILTQVWLTTLAEAVTDPLGAIWIRPVDYRTALLGTPFERNIRHARSIYERQSARERFVDANAEKHAILAPSD